MKINDAFKQYIDFIQQMDAKPEATVVEFIEHQLNGGHVFRHPITGRTVVLYRKPTCNVICTRDANGELGPHWYLMDLASDTERVIMYLKKQRETL